MNFPTFPMRQVHLDFHTSPDIPDVGADWDADHFIETLTRARVNSITVFAKCHHGMNYYPTKIGPVHPSLKFDLLGAQIEACHRAGIRCPIYLSVVWDVSAAERHPEWRQVSVTGEFIGRLKPCDSSPLPFTAWPYLCMNNGYADELLAQTEELMRLYDCDGFFYDIVMYHGDGCVCANCLRSLKEAGLNPEDPLHRRRNNHASARLFMERASRLIRGKLPDAGIYYNSRWGLHFADEKELYSQIEIESLPTGGWGYGFYPLWSRYGRTFEDLPMLGMTGRFHRNWADWGGLKHPDALRFECGGILATGGAVSIGDQLHPRGKLNRAVYEVIGGAFRDVEAVEPYCVGAKADSQVGLLVLNPSADKANQDTSGNIEGAAKMLLELHHQFDVITDTTCPDFSRYDLIVLADKAAASEETARRLREFVAQGGRLLLSHEALLSDGAFLLADEMGVDYLGPASCIPDYFQITEPGLHGPVTRPDFAYSLYDGPTARVGVREGTQILADAYETYFNRTGVHFSSHGFTPPLAEKAQYPAVTRRGSVIYIYGPVFGAYQRYGSLAFRALVGKCLDLLLPEKRVVTDAPPSAELSLMRQGSRHLVHIVNYSPQRRAPGHVEALDSPVPLRDVLLRLRRPEGAQKAYLARSGEELPLTIESEPVVCSVIVPRVAAHEIVVFE